MEDGTGKQQPTAYKYVFCCIGQDIAANDRQFFVRSGGDAGGLLESGKRRVTGKADRERNMPVASFLLPHLDSRYKVTERLIANFSW